MDELRLLFKFTHSTVVVSLDLLRLKIGQLNWRAKIFSFKTD